MKARWTGRPTSGRPSQRPFLPMANRKIALLDFTIEANRNTVRDCTDGRPVRQVFLRNANRPAAQDYPGSVRASRLPGRFCFGKEDRRIRLAARGALARSQGGVRN